MSLFVRRSGLVRLIVHPRCIQSRVQRRGFTASLRLRDAEDVADENGNRHGVEPSSRASTKNESRLTNLRRTERLPSSKPRGVAVKARTILGQSPDLPIRARFAPSPTGYLHLGSLRTALFNKLATSASHNGSFILRIEDTDQSRLVPDAEERLLKDLQWAGLEWQEGPDVGGPYGPYRQSERLDIYKEHIEILLDRHDAYRCFCNLEQLNAEKLKLHEAGKPTHYPGTCRHVERAESDRRAAEGESHVVRLDARRFGRPKFKDAIYGPFQKDAEEDFILLKTDGFPTYHFANVVDDHLMQITHVIRGDEWLISTPKHLALYMAFGWEPPTFAHLGLLVDVDNSKLSKRNASVNISTYTNDGIFPMALNMWLANLGSSTQANIETPRTIDDVANALTFKFTKGGIKLNPRKLHFFQSEYRRAMTAAPIAALEEKETQLINECVVQPALSEFQAITNGAGEAPDQPWQQPSPEPIPALAAADQRSLDHLRTVMMSFTVSRDGALATPASQLRQHPYLFWRPPASLYRASLAKARPSERVLEHLDAVLSELEPAIDIGALTSQPWNDGEPGDAATMHTTIRLLVAGTLDSPTVATRLLAEFLGKEEWKHRLDVVRRLLREMEHGGA